MKTWTTREKWALTLTIAAFILLVLLVIFLIVSGGPVLEGGSDLEELQNS